MKKVLALVLTVVLAFGMASVAFAATYQVKAIDGTNATKDLYLNSSGATWAEDISDLRPDTELKLFLNPEWFVDAAGASGNPVYTPGTDTMTESIMRREKITVKRSISKGGDLLDSVDFGSETADTATFGSGKTTYVSVEFVEHFISTSDKDFDYTIYLALDGTRVRATEYVLAGTMANPEDQVYEDDDYCSGEEGTVIKAEDYVRNIEMYLGDGVSAHLNMFKGTKYYGTATNEISSSDDAVLNQYPSIDTVIVIRQVNLNGSAVKYTFDMDGDYYVYNTDGNYIGTTNDELPYSAKYYLSSERITMGGGSTDEPSESSTTPTEPTEPSDPEQPGMGGDGDTDYVDNTHDNPGTGVNGFVNVAIVACVVSLAAAGAVAMKK